MTDNIEKSEKSKPEKSDWEKRHEAGKKWVDSKELEPLWACVGKHVSYWSDIELIQSEIITATTKGDQSSVAFVLDNSRLTPTGRATLFRKCIERVVPKPVEKKLLLDVWKKGIAPVGALRRRFAHWVWQAPNAGVVEEDLKKSGLWPFVILYPPYVFLERSAKARAEGKPYAGGFSLTVQEWSGIYDLKKLEIVCHEAWRAAMNAEIVRECVLEVLRDGSIPHLRFHQLQGMRGRQLLPCHRKLLEFHPHSGYEDGQD